MDKGDTTVAKEYIDQFFAKAPDEEIAANDLVLRGKIYGATTGDPTVALESFKKAALMDTVKETRKAIIADAKKYFKDKGNKIMEAEMNLFDYDVNDKSNIAALFNTGVTFYQANAYQRADSIFVAYAKANPDSIYGYLWSAYSRAAIDTSMEQGLAVPAYKKLLEIASRDKERFKSQGVAASGYLAGYYNNILSDKDSAIVYLQKGLEFDPANQSFIKNIEILQKSGKQPAKKPGSAKAAATKSSTGK